LSMTMFREIAYHHAQEWAMRAVPDQILSGLQEYL
jgi:hypothetical protein